MQKIFSVLVVIIVIQMSSFAQVQKDTLLGKWGTHTIWQKGINDKKYSSIDTSLNNVHQFDTKFKKEDFFQDLGAIGSSYRSLEFLNQNSVFKTMNQDVFEHYSFGNERKFYKTYGPFTKLEYDFRGKDNTFIEGIYTQNVNENWNIGFQFRRLRYAKLYEIIEPIALINSTSLRFFTSYKSKNNKYNLLADYNSINHNQLEMGGVDLDGMSVVEGYFSWYNLNAQLSAKSRFETRNYFLKHSYKIDSTGKLALFHQFDRKRELHKFIDESIDFNANSVLLISLFKSIDENNT